MSCCIRDTPNEAGNVLDSETPGRSEGVQVFRIRCATLKMLHVIVSEKCYVTIRPVIKCYIATSILILIYCTVLYNVGWDSVVGIATRYGLDDPGIESRLERDFPHLSQTGPEAHPFSYTIGTWSFPGVKRPGRGVDNPSHLAPRLKKE